jgi:hypothetical protein
MKENFSWMHFQIHRQRKRSLALFQVFRLDIALTFQDVVQFSENLVATKTKNPEVN